MTSLLERATSREVLVGHDGRSGARLERVVLDDGRRLVVKRTVPAEDLTLRLTGHVDREAELWRSGGLRLLPPGLGHAVLEVTQEDSTTVTIMRDLGDAVPGWSRVLPTGEVSRILRALAGLHRAYDGRVPLAAASLETRIGLLTPQRLGHLVGSVPLAGHVVRGWEHFFDVVDDATAAGVAALHEDPGPLIRALRRGRQTLLHADLWLVNLALLDDEVVFLDWALATEGPPALDLAVFLTGSAAYMEPSREAVIAQFRDLEPDVDDGAMCVALLAGLVEMGWNKALDATSHPDQRIREREAADLGWWVDRARAGLRLLG